MSTTEGLQLPLIPLFDVVGSEGTVLPAQIDKAVPKSKPGVRVGVTVTVKEVAVAHCPDEGVKA